MWNVVSASLPSPQLKVTISIASKNATGRGISAIRQLISIISHNFYCTYAKLPYFYFRFDINVTIVFLDPDFL